MSEEINMEVLGEEKKEYLSSEKHTVLRHALSHSPFNKVVGSLDTSAETDFTFSIDLKTLPVSNQLHSGRCWIFSASTVLREIIAKKCFIESQFEISQNYISYYDKLEKFNYYMEHVIDLAFKGEKKDGRKMAFLLSGVGDGGQWDMYADLVKKYGIVPKAAFSETSQSNETRMSTLLGNSALRQFAAEVYKGLGKGAKKDELEALKDSYMKKIYALLTDSFGVPPEKFDFEYVDKDGKYHIEKDLTPKSFFQKYVGDEIDEFVSLINAPTADKKYYQTYHVELVGNVVGGKPITHLNLPYERLEELMIKQLEGGEIVWFGSDVSYFREREDGIWDDSAFDYKTPFGIDLEFDKADMLDFHHSAMNHAMCVTGVDIKDGKPVRWKIENSWGSDSGKKGYYVMNEGFFRSFVYQAAIRKKYLGEEERKALEKEPVLLPPWDPFGTLAD